MSREVWPSLSALLWSLGDLKFPWRAQEYATIFLHAIAGGCVDACIKTQAPTYLPTYLPRHVKWRSFKRTSLSKYHKSNPGSDPQCKEKGLYYNKLKGTGNNWNKMATYKSNNTKFESMQGRVSAQWQQFFLTPFWLLIEIPPKMYWSHNVQCDH